MEHKQECSALGIRVSPTLPLLSVWNPVRGRGQDSTRFWRSPGQTRFALPRLASQQAMQAMPGIQRENLRLGWKELLGV